jgi:tetratricopeptide (TPR) repeat protein
MTELQRNTFDAALQDGEASLRNSEPRLTVARCSEVLASYPDSVRALRLRGRAFDALSNFQRAAADYQRVLDITPLDIESMVSLALCQQDLRKGADALTMARQALEHEPMNDDALRLLRESGEEAPDRGRLAMLRQKFDAGAVRKVIVEMRRLVEVLPDRPDVQTLLAEMHFRSGAPIAAAEVCQRLLDDQPDCLPAHALLALVWQKAGAEAVAAAHLREVERLDPDFREIALWLKADAPAAPRDVPAWVETQASVAAAQEPDEAEHAAYVDSLIAPIPLPAPEKLVFQRAEDEDAAEIVSTEPLAWESAVADAPDEADEPLPDWLRDLREMRPEGETADAEPFDIEPPPYSIERALGGGIEEIGEGEGEPGVTMEAASEAAAVPPDLPAPPKPRKGRKPRPAARHAAGENVMAESPAPAAADDKVPALGEDAPEAALIEPEADTASPLPAPAAVAAPAPEPELLVDEEDGLDIPEVVSVPAHGEIAPLEWVPAGDAPPPTASPPAAPKRPTVKRSMPLPTPPKGKAAPASAPEPEPAAVAPAEPEPIAEPKRAKKDKKGKGKGKGKKDVVELDDDGLLELARISVVEQDFDRAERYFADFITRGRRVDRALADLEEITQTRPQLWRYFELLGKLHTRKGRVAEALAAYQRALERMR